MELSTDKRMIKQLSKQVSAITREASLASRAIARLESAAAAQLNGSEATMQLAADTDGITALIKDEHGTAVIIQKGKISVNVAAPSQE